MTGDSTETIALLIQISIGPNSRSTASAAASTASGSAMSVGRTRALPPASSTSRRAPSNPSRPRANSPILAPRFANARTVARPTPADAPVITTTSGSLGFPFDAGMHKSPYSTSKKHERRKRFAGNVLHHLANLVRDDRLDDVPAVFLTSCHRLREMPGLFHRDLARQRGLIRIDDCLDQCGAGMGKRLFQDGFNLLWITHGIAARSASSSKRREVDRLQLYAELRITFESNLLPLDHA